MRTDFSISWRETTYKLRLQANTDGYYMRILAYWHLHRLRLYTAALSSCRTKAMNKLYTLTRVDRLFLDFMLLNYKKSFSAVHGVHGVINESIDWLLKVKEKISRKFFTSCPARTETTPKDILRPSRSKIALGKLQPTKIRDSVIRRMLRDFFFWRSFETPVISSRCLRADRIECMRAKFKPYVRNMAR